MIRQLYQLEDWLFYRSRTCTPAVRGVAETVSRNVGVFADRLQAGLRNSRTT